MHLGDPCIHCGQAHDEVSAGPCVNANGNAARIRRFLYWKKLLADHEKRAAAETSRLKELIQAENTGLLQIEKNLDLTQIALAESVMYVRGDFKSAGEDREACRTQAVHWFATGESRGHYGDLRHEYFGTKDYDRWHGQSSDHEYGYGPRHGSIIFCIGLCADARQRNLTDAEKEACVYYLLNLTMIQKTQAEAKQSVA